MFWSFYCKITNPAAYTLHHAHPTSFDSILCSALHATYHLNDHRTQPASHTPRPRWLRAALSGQCLKVGIPKLYPT